VKTISTFSVGLFAVAFIGYVGCSNQVGPSYRYNVSSGQYLFLEQHSHSQGELIQGQSWPQLHIDFPMYSFNPTSGTLKGNIDFPIDGNLIAVCGHGSSVRGCLGSGASTAAIGIYDLPYHSENDYLVVTNIDTGGTVSLRYFDSLIVLAPGKEWLSVSTHIDTLMDSLIAKVTYTDRITNYGFLQKSKIQSDN
jgi:hypothetical protein